MNETLAWAQAQLVPILVFCAWLVLGAIGEKLDRDLAKVDAAKSPRVAGLRDLLASVGLTPSRAIRGLLAVLSVRVGVKPPDDGDPPMLGGGGGPSDAPRDDDRAMRHAVTLCAGCVLALAFILPGCGPDALSKAIRSSNVALDVGNAGADVLDRVCTKPMQELAIKVASASPEARAPLVAKAADLAAGCDPAVGTHESLRGAHRALRVVILSVESGVSQPADLFPAMVRLAGAAAELEKALAELVKWPEKKKPAAPVPSASAFAPVKGAP